MRRIAVPLLVAILATACSTAKSQRPSGFAPPDIRVEALGNLFFGSGNTAPISFDVEIANRAQTPLRVREIEITSPGMSTYSIRPVRRQLNETVAPGASTRVSLFSTAVTSVRDPREPLTVRTIVIFEANGSRWREILHR